MENFLPRYSAEVVGAESKGHRLPGIGAQVGPVVLPVPTGSAAVDQSRRNPVGHADGYIELFPIRHAFRAQHVIQRRRVQLGRDNHLAAGWQCRPGLPGGECGTPFP